MILSSDELHTEVLDLLRAGASAYLRKGIAGFDLARGLSAVVAAHRSAGLAAAAWIVGPSSQRRDRRELLVVDEVGGGEDEDLAHQVGVLLIAAHECDDAAAGRQLDDLVEAMSHDLLELHPLTDDRRARVRRRAGSARHG